MGLNKDLLRLAALPLLVLSLQTGCTQKSPYEQIVLADTDRGFQDWRADLIGPLTREEFDWFNVAIQEYKFQIMLNHEATGSEAIDPAMRANISGRRLLDVMREGLETCLQRKRDERDQLHDAIAVNSVNGRKLIKPDDSETKNQLDDFQAGLRRKLAKLKDESAAIEAELVKLPVMTKP